MATEKDVFWEVLYFDHVVQMQAAHWSKLGRTISGSVDKGDPEFLLTPSCALLLFTMEQATERYNTRKSPPI